MTINGQFVTASNDNGTFTDVLGDATGVPGPPQIGTWLSGPRFNIDDPKFEDKWDTAPLTLGLLTEEKEPESCEDKCADIGKKRRENCAIVRKRVAASLKKAGCPSRVLAMKQHQPKKKVCVTKKKKGKTRK